MCSTHTYNLPLGEWGGCCCWKLSEKLNTHRGKCAPERGGTKSRWVNNNALWKYAHVHGWAYALTHKYSWPYTHTHTHLIHLTNTHAKTRADTQTVPDTDPLCPAPLSSKMSSFQQALIFLLSLHLSFISLRLLPISLSLSSKFATIQKSKMWKTRSPPNTNLISWFN